MPVALRGTNNQATMQAGVSCLTIGGTRTATLTGTFPVTTGLGAGDAKVATTLDLPSPCVAPIVADHERSRHELVRRQRRLGRLATHTRHPAPAARPSGPRRAQATVVVTPR